MMLEQLAIGHPYPREFHGDGPRVVFHPSGLEILFAMSEPNDYEIGSFKTARETKIGFAKWDRLGVLLVDFGEGLSVEVPFDAGIERPENVPALDITSDFSRVPFTFIGVDPANGNKIFGMRYITASPRVSRYLVKEVKAQLSAPVDVRTYTSRVAELYARYPTTKSLEKIALAYDKAGGQDPSPSAADAAAATPAWLAVWGAPEILPSAAKLLTAPGAMSLEAYQARILSGDYGLQGLVPIGTDDSTIDTREPIVLVTEAAKAQKCNLWEVDSTKMPAINVGIPQSHANRLGGRRFTALFEVPGHGVLYFSINEFGRTIVCDYNDK